MAIDRNQLTKILGQLGSDNPNVRAVAGKKANDIVKANGGDWGQVLATGSTSERVVIKHVRVPHTVDRKIFVPVGDDVKEIELEWYEYIGAGAVWLYLMLIATTIGFVVSIFTGQGYYPYFYVGFWLFSVCQYWKLRRTITIENDKRRIQRDVLKEKSS